MTDEVSFAARGPALSLSKGPFDRLRTSRWLTLWSALCVLGAVASLRLAVAWHVPLPFCLLRRLDWHPLPCLRLHSQCIGLDRVRPVAAFTFNPLFCLCCLVGACWLLGRGIGLASGGRYGWTTTGRSGFRRWPWGKVVAALAALNWIYLCFNLPK
jgi:hypothetical protein